MRSLFIAFLALALLGVGNVHACVSNTPKAEPFISRVGHVLDFSKVPRNQQEVYLLFSGTQAEMNELVMRARAVSIHPSGKTPVYTSFALAQQNATARDTHVIGVNRQKGEVFEVSTVDGRRLNYFVPKGGCGTGSWE